jgi:hypothetical protein
MINTFKVDPAITDLYGQREYEYDVDAVNNRMSIRLSDGEWFDPMSDHDPDDYQVAEFAMVCYDIQDRNAEFKHQVTGILSPLLHRRHITV